MDPYFWHFLYEHGLAVIACLTVISIVGLRSWMRANTAAQLVQLAESSLDREQLEAALTGLSGRHLANRGLLEQLGSLSWGTRVGLFLLAEMAISLLLAVTHTRSVPTNVNRFYQTPDSVFASSSAMWSASTEVNLIQNDMPRKERLQSVDSQLNEANP